MKNRYEWRKQKAQFYISIIINEAKRERESQWTILWDRRGMRISWLEEDSLCSATSEVTRDKTQSF